MSTRTMTVQTAGMPSALVLALVIAAMIGAAATILVALDSQAGRGAAPAVLGESDDFALRHLGITISSAPQLTRDDDYATRHSGAESRAGVLTPAADYGTRHAIVDDGQLLTEADDYGTRGTRPTRFGPPGR